jgi:hypothetical protein
LPKALLWLLSFTQCFKPPRFRMPQIMSGVFLA